MGKMCREQFADGGTDHTLVSGDEDALEGEQHRGGPSRDSSGWEQWRTGCVATLKALSVFEVTAF